MPPTESQILSTTLLNPSSLPTIVPLRKFTALFPASLRSHPQIPALYRALQHQRNLDLDDVRAAISDEAARGALQMREVARTRARDLQDSGLETDMGIVGPGAEDGGALWIEGMDGVRRSNAKAHTLESIVPAMEKAVAEMEDEVTTTEQEAEAVTAEVEAIVGSLSDLRYGRFMAEPGGRTVREEVLEGLGELERAVDERLEKRHGKEARLVR